MSDQLQNELDLRGVHLWLILWKAYDALKGQAEQSIASLGICFTDFAILEFLLHKGPSPVNVIGKTVAISSGSVSVAVDRLVERGLVARCPHSTDRRTRVVSLTEIGADLISSAFEEHAQAMEGATASLSPREREILIPLLKRLGKGAGKKGKE
jgi:MarR family 2-MHQ and catechol resistance regulon transcriptional repressor